MEHVPPRERLAHIIVIGRRSLHASCQAIHFHSFRTAHFVPAHLSDLILVCIAISVKPAVACRKRRILAVRIASILSIGSSRLPEALTHSHALAHSRGKEQLKIRSVNTSVALA